MLRITIHEEEDSTTLKLEGRLTGVLVEEAEDCWRRVRAAARHPAVCFDLTGVTGIDSAGKALLAAAHAEGVRLTASGCMMRAIVAELGETSGECPSSEHENV